MITYHHGDDHLTSEGDDLVYLAQGFPDDLGLFDGSTVIATGPDVFDACPHAPLWEERAGRMNIYLCEVRGEPIDDTMVQAVRRTCPDFDLEQFRRAARFIRDCFREHEPPSALSSAN